MEWAEIVDTTVKIGLGALIAGVAGYMANSANHKHAEKEIYVQKRRDYLDKAIEILNDFHKRYVRYRTKVHNAVDRRDLKIENTTEQESELENLYVDLMDAFEHFVDAEGYILAINEKGLHETMYSYMEQISTLSNELWYGNIEQLKSTRIDEINTTIRRERRAFLLKLSKAYQ